MEPEAMYEGDAKLLIAVEIGVADQGDSDDLTIAEFWLGASASPSPVATFQGFVGVINVDVPDGEDIFPAFRCDIIG
jgi:hypothetical protein